MNPSGRITTKNLIIGSIAVASLALFAYALTQPSRKRKQKVSSRGKSKNKRDKISKTFKQKPIDIHLVMETFDGFNAHIAADAKNSKLGLKYGSKLTKINGKRVSNCTYEDIFAMLQNANAPITLVFVVMPELNKQWKQALKLKNEANANYKNGLTTQAIKTLSDAIELHATNKVFYSNRILMYLKLEQYENALNDCQTIRELDPKSVYVKGHYLRGLVLLNLKKYKNAMSAFQTVLKLQPQFKKAQDRYDECMKYIQIQNELDGSEIMDIKKYELIDDMTKCLVDGYMRSMQNLMDEHMNHLIIPNHVNKICAVFFYIKYPGFK